MSTKTTTITTNNNPNTKEKISQHITLRENDLVSDEYIHELHSRNIFVLVSRYQL